MKVKQVELVFSTMSTMQLITRFIKQNKYKKSYNV